MDPIQYQVIKHLLANGSFKKDIAAALGIHRTTVSRVAISSSLEDYHQANLERYNKYHKPGKGRPVAKKNQPKDWDDFTSQAPFLERIGPDGKEH